MRLLKRIPRRREAPRAGTSSVELALTLPIFGILVAGLMEFSHYYLVVHSLNGAARRGALLGSYEGTTNAQVISKVESVVAGSLNTGNVTVSIKDGSVFDTSNVNPNTLNYNSLPEATLSDLDTTDCFLVQATVPYDDVALLPPFWIKNATVTGRAVMRHE